MLTPFTCKPQEIASFDPECVAKNTTQCMCGRTVPIRDVNCVWTTSPKTTDPTWFAACSQRCILAHVTGGNC